jgi:hypothetical protein
MIRVHPLVAPQAFVLLRSTVSPWHLFASLNAYQFSFFVLLIAAWSNSLVVVI